MRLLVISSFKMLNHFMMGYLSNMQLFFFLFYFHNISFSFSWHSDDGWSKLSFVGLAT